MPRAFLLLLICCLVGGAPLRAQVRDSVESLASPLSMTSREGTRQDSVQRLPLTLFSQMPAGARRDYIHRWRLHTEAWRYTPEPIDSSFHTSHLFDDRLKTDHPRAHLGIRYAPLLYDEFFARPSLEASLPPSLHAIWLHLQPRHATFQAQGPFSHFNASNHFSSSEGELYARWFYTQNLAPGLNFAFNVQHAEDKSQMVNLSSRYNLGELYASWVAGRWYLSGSAIVRRMEHALNGGIETPYWQRDTVMPQGQMPVTHVQNNTLAAADLFTLEEGFNLIQQTFERHDTVEHIRYQYNEPVLTAFLMQQYRRLSRAYVEPNPPARRHYLIADNYTHDSVAVTGLDLRFALAYRHQPHSRLFFPSLRAWVGLERNQYLQPQALLYLRGYATAAEASGYLGASTDYDLRYLYLQAAARLYAVGERAGDFALHASLRLLPLPKQDALNLRLLFATERRRLAYLAQHHYSNTAAWDLDLPPTTYLHTAAELSLPWGNVSLGAANRLYRHYFYFDVKTLPAQTDLLNVLSLYYQQHLQWKGLDLSGRLVFQTTSDAHILALPLLTAHASLGYELEPVSGVLRMRLALDATYRTAYYADAYNVPLGVFYRQETYQLGDYPLLDLVLNVKWKTANIFVMVGHLNEEWFGRNAFSGVLYPERERNFRFGFQWYFYTPRDEEKAF